MLTNTSYAFMFSLQDTLDAVENLLKKHEAFEKSAATQEERFASLEKPTTVNCLCQKDYAILSTIIMSLSSNL